MGSPDTLAGTASRAATTDYTEDVSGREGYAPATDGTARDTNHR